MSVFKDVSCTLKPYQACRNNTFKDVSYDEVNHESMIVHPCHPNGELYNFDEISKQYTHCLNVSKPLRSNDAIYLFNNLVYFIEFKNGTADKFNLKGKIYDSLLVLVEIGKELNCDSPELWRDKLIYVLVQEESNQPRDKAIKKVREPIMKRSNIPYDPYDLFHMKGLFFKDMYLLSTEEFINRFCIAG